MDNTDLLNTLLQIISDYQNPKGYVNLALLGKALQQREIDYKTLGYAKLTELVNAFPDSVELVKNTDNSTPVVYARLKPSITSPAQPAAIPAKKAREPLLNPLLSWAWMGNFPNVIASLKRLALPERWFYSEQTPANPFPILKNYLTYTFFRLLKEDKIAYQDGYAAFNTGLVNRLYEPIYALFEKNRVTGKQEWYFDAFCVAGGGLYGRILATHFNPLPECARFFKDVNEIIYDVYSPLPEIDWNNIILHNLSRLPMAFLEKYLSDAVQIKDTAFMKNTEKTHYFHKIANALQHNNDTLHAIKNRFKECLSLALKRVQWNYKMAIPMYYPATNSILLLLPLALADDNVIDLALVIEKTPSGRYFGKTLLPLDRAYGNARLIARLDTDWLAAKTIISGEKALDCDVFD